MRIDPKSFKYRHADAYKIKTKIQNYKIQQMPFFRQTLHESTFFFVVSLYYKIFFLQNHEMNS